MRKRGMGTEARRRGAWAFGLPGVAVTFAVVLAGCADLLGPDRDVTPHLRTLAIDGALVNGAFVTIDASPYDQTFRLEADERVPVEIEVSSGDREAVGLYREWCPARRGVPIYRCFTFLVMMQSGRSVIDVADRVAAIGGRFQYFTIVGGGTVWVSGTLAAVVLFSPGDVVRQARRARSWPGVAITDLSWPGGCIEPGACAPLPVNDFTLPVRVDTGAARPNDGTLQVRTGDTVLARYRQPVGGRIEARRVVP